VDLLSVSAERARATRRLRGALAAALASVLALGAGACTPHASVTAVVEGVDAEYGQVTLSQPGVEGLLPAGTVAVRVEDPLLDALAPGQVIEAEVARGDAGPVLAAARFVRWAGPEEGWIESAGRRVRAERAEPISLWDTAGRKVSLEDWRGRIVLLDFIFTNCPGPCPAQTHNMRQVQKGLSEAARPHVQLVSVTIDPERDDAAAMAAYAERHSADRSGWSFLTGPVDTVEDTYHRYGIGVTDGEGGSMDHTLKSFVIDDRGYVVERYRSDAFDPDAVVARLEQLVAAASARQG